MLLPARASALERRFQVSQRAGLAGLPSLNRRCAVHATSIHLTHKLPLLKRRRVVVRIIHLALGELDLFARQFLVRDDVQDVADAVQAGTPLVIGTQDVPRRGLALRGDFFAMRTILPHAIPNGQWQEGMMASEHPPLGTRHGGMEAGKAAPGRRKPNPLGQGATGDALGRERAGRRAAGRPGRRRR
jgi:hypothetical protein